MLRLPEPSLTDALEGGRSRVGRPRADKRPLDREPREEILAVAAELFATVGYGATTTRAVAAAAGLRQSSLFHYFASKDELLAELLDRTVAPALAFVDWLGERAEPPLVKLHALAWRDSANLCAGPTNLGALQLLPEARADRFASFWSARARLRAGYADLVAGTAASDSEVLTDLVFGLVESVITWFDQGGLLSAEAAADQVALGVLRLVKPGRGSYGAVRKASARLLGSAKGRAGAPRTPAQPNEPDQPTVIL